MPLRQSGRTSLKSFQIPMRFFYSDRNRGWLAEADGKRYNVVVGHSSAWWSLYNRDCPALVRGNNNGLMQALVQLLREPIRSPHLSPSRHNRRVARRCKCTKDCDEYYNVWRMELGIEWLAIKTKGPTSLFDANLFGALTSLPDYFHTSAMFLVAYRLSQTLNHTAHTEFGCLASSPNGHL
ncbi:hypothetical protein J6590_063678, partial [Homalodisca vitripennis]